MVVIFILSIVSLIAIPSFQSVIQNNRLTTAKDDLASLLQYARSEAVRSGGNVSVRSISGDISNGFRVLSLGKNGNPEEYEELMVLRIDSRSINISAKEGSSDITDLNVLFDSRGYARDLSNSVTISLCDQRTGNYGRQMQLLTSGALRLSNHTYCS